MMQEPEALTVIQPGLSEGSWWGSGTGYTPRGPDEVPLPTESRYLTPAQGNTQTLWGENPIRKGVGCSPSIGGSTSKYVNGA